MPTYSGSYWKYAQQNKGVTFQSDSCATNLGNNQSRLEEALGRYFFKEMNLIKLLMY